MTQTAAEAESAVPDGLRDQLFEERLDLSEGEAFIEKPFRATGLREAARRSMLGFPERGAGPKMPIQSGRVSPIRVDVLAPDQLRHHDGRVAGLAEREGETGPQVQCVVQPIVSCLGLRDDRLRSARSCYFRGSGCSRKNAHIWLEASMLRVVGPANHSGKGLPPGQVWPPPSIV